MEFPAKSLIPVVKVAVNKADLFRLLLGVNVAFVVLAVLLSLVVTDPVTAFDDESLIVNVLVVMLELSINSLKFAVMLVTNELSPSEGDVEVIVGTTVSIMKEVRVIMFPAFPAESVTMMVQLS